MKSNKASMRKPNPIAGNNAVPVQKRYLFTDLRHIQCGRVKWTTPDGNFPGTMKPSIPEVEAHAGTGFAPHGIRLAAQQANTTRVPEAKTGRIIYDEGMYRSWYLETLETGASQPEVCYTESRNGFTWTKPRKSPVNVPAKASHEFGFCIDPHGSPQERYKAVFPGIPPKEEWSRLWKKQQKVYPLYYAENLSENKIRCLYAAVSPDGVKWTVIPEPLMVHAGDTGNNIHYDERLRRYVMYTRLYMYDRRWVGRSESEDFRHWGPVMPVIWPDLHWQYSWDIYSNAWTEYPGLPQYQMMFPWIFKRYTEGGSVRLYSSEDGICWNEVPGGEVIPLGAPGEWNSEYIGTSGSLVPFPFEKDRVGMKYGGRAMPHKYPRWKSYPGGAAWAWWPEGRVCAVTAEEEGEFFTFSIVPAGRELRVNVRTRRAAEVRVGLVASRPAPWPVAGIDGRSATDCDPIFGDGLAKPVHWKGKTDIGTKEGEPVILHFKLRAAELFGFEWV